jgi:hypothetical protein
MYADMLIHRIKSHSRISGTVEKWKKLGPVGTGLYGKLN